VLFDSKSKFAAHFDYIMPRAYAMFGFVKRNASLFTDPYTRLALYFAFVRSNLEYASLIWNPFTTTHGNRIERLQKQFLKFALLPLRFLDPTPLYHQQCRLVHHLACRFVSFIRSASLFPQAAQNCGSYRFDDRIQILTEMYCSHQYLSIDLKKSLPLPLKRPQAPQTCDAHNFHARYENFN